jgi:hypothetical protein
MGDQFWWSWDVGARFDYVNGYDARIDASGSGPGITLTTTEHSTGHAIRLAGEVGFRPHPRIRPFIGAGLHRFDLKSEQTVSLNGDTDSDTQEYRGFDPNWHAGIDWTVNGRFGLHGEYVRPCR